ncbi:protein kinase family protein [Aspergillus vadensis CBS 113365]|uniref:non-specific serine/threonine protein kinase n=1 Tax=Aspergillus vadensis (strain CBS 113365 / IMI 142717 / IBT 24658) TaxID=1448311 RepID=A0A319AWP2_ASPVC|nr:hypothetical protein BO88DRAFT_429217 [Aspergillus vadensis CBS 113365]PYH64776.1 hypothetical protein BO88DRAFT_429217 [Aspergillus vadensis CBS 113365]
MPDDARIKAVDESTMQNALNWNFIRLFNSLCEANDLSCTSDALNYLSRTDIQSLTLQLLLDLEHSAICGLTPRYSRAAALDNIQKLKTAIILSEAFDLSLVQFILASAIACTPDNDIWECIDDAVIEYTRASSQQIQHIHNTSSFATLSEHRQYIDRILKAEVGSLYVGIPQFHAAFFGCVRGLQEASQAVFQRCRECTNPLFVADRWEGWPKDASQEDVLTWFSDLNDKLANLSKDYCPESAQLRRPVARPNRPIQGSTEERKLDIGFVSEINAGKNTKCLWVEILVPGVLKSDPAADTAAKTWLDLGRIWAFDRLGGVASDRFDINENGLQFVSIILGFLWMSGEQYGFDPTIIITEDGRRFIEIEQEGQVQRLFLERLIKRTPCIAGRATTCWKAYREDDPGIPLVVKDSWQDTEHDEEGSLLQEATNAGVVNVARYYHHSNVCVPGKVDDVRYNIRGGLNIRTATSLHRSEQAQAPSAGASVADAQHKGRSTDRPNIERPSSQDSAILPPIKRPRLSSPNDTSKKSPNRIHRRVILRDYGKPIYTASTHSVLLAALEQCITGHQSLHEKGILHRDISLNNLLINENNNNNPSWPAFVIDLDLAIKEQSDIPTPESNGTPGSKGRRRTVAIFARWIFVDTDDLAVMKQGFVFTEVDYLRWADKYFTTYYKPLVSCVNALRKVVFPGGNRWMVEDMGLYERMKEVLRAGREDEFDMCVEEAVTESL